MTAHRLTSRLPWTPGCHGWTVDHALLAAADHGLALVRRGHSADLATPDGRRLFQLGGGEASGHDHASRTFLLTVTLTEL